MATTKLGRAARIAVIGTAAFLIAAAQPYRPVVITGASMAPTYSNYEVVLEKPADRPLQRGDVVIIHTKAGTIIKRVAFLAGDRISQVWINNAWSDLVSIHPPFRKPNGTTRTHIRTITIPPGCIYVLGDNSLRSIDSRTFGPVPAKDVQGLVADQRPFDSQADGQLVASVGPSVDGHSAS